MSEDSGIRVLAGRYRLITPLGSRVMRGWDTHLRRVVAVRVFPPPDGSDQVPERLAKLVDLVHPGLVRVLDAGNADGEPFLVAEFIAGTTLKARLTDGPLPAETVGPIGTQLAKALAYAHSHDVVHRDVSPGNVLLGPGDEPYLAHLGIAAEPTPSYMAPEQVTGSEPTSRSDVYALGLVLLEALTGKTQYPGSDTASIRFRLNHSPEIPEDLPFATVLSAMTAPNPADRPDAATCADLLRGDSAKARRQTRTVLVAALAAAVVATTVMLITNSSDPSPGPQVNTDDPLREVAAAPLNTAPNVPYQEQVPSTPANKPAPPPAAPPRQVPPDTTTSAQVEPPPPVNDFEQAMAPVTYQPPQTHENRSWFLAVLEHVKAKKVPPGQARKQATEDDQGDGN